MRQNHQKMNRLLNMLSARHSWKNHYHFITEDLYKNPRGKHYSQLHYTEQETEARDKQT